MSKFKKGDRVRVISITDIDADYDDPKRVMTTNEQLVEAGFIVEMGPVIGATGVVVDFYNDYYDLSIKLDRDGADNEYWSMVEADLELITE